MGLLGTGFDDPQAQAIMALAGGLLRRDAGGGLLGANQAFLAAKQAQQQQAMQQMQMRQVQMGLDREQRAMQTEEQLRKAATDSYGMPSQGGFGIGADGAQMATPRPQFDMRQYVDRVMQIDPVKGIGLQQAMQKDETPLVVAPGATLVNRRTMKPEFTAPKEQSLPSDVQAYQFAQGQGYQGTYEQWDRERKKAGATNVVTQVSTNADKSYFGNVAEGLAKNDVAAIEAGRSAPERVETARRVKSILAANPITGTGAEARLAVTKALATAGVIDGTTVANTEVLASTLAAQALDAIKSSGLGGGSGFSNADREFLERARAGKIDMSAPSLARIADLNERAAAASIKRANTVIGKLRNSPQAGQMGQMLEEVQVPTQSSGAPKSVVRTGTLNGRKVVQYSDGSTAYAD